MIEQAQVGDWLLSYGESESDPFLTVLFGGIRGVQKRLKFTAYQAVHVQILGSDDNWYSAEDKGVVAHVPRLRSDGKYRLCRLREPLTQTGIRYMQAFLEGKVGTKYDGPQIASYLAYFIPLIPLSSKRYIAKRFNNGKLTVCSDLVWHALKCAAPKAFPLPRLDPNYRNPWERATPADLEPENNPEYFELVAEQGF